MRILMKSSIFIGIFGISFCKSRNEQSEVKDVKLQSERYVVSYELKCLSGTLPPKSIKIVRRWPNNWQGGFRVLGEDYCGPQNFKIDDSLVKEEKKMVDVLVLESSDSDKDAIGPRFYQILKDIKMALESGCFGESSCENQLKKLQNLTSQLVKIENEMDAKYGNDGTGTLLWVRVNFSHEVKELYKKTHNLLSDYRFQGESCIDFLNVINRLADAMENIIFDGGLKLERIQRKYCR